MEIIGIILSIMAIALSAYTYFNHDRKIKKQEKLLNDYQLAKVEKEKIELRRAMIDAKVLKKRDGLNGIIICNTGKSIARSVYVTIPEDELYEVLNNPCPIDLRPQQSIEITMALFNNFPDKIELKFEWKDEFKEVNIEMQPIQLL
jgi:hypothetical protein